MDRSNTNWDRNGTEIIQCQFEKKEDRIPCILAEEKNKRWPK